MKKILLGAACLALFSSCRAPRPSRSPAAGLARVEVRFPDGKKIQAELADDPRSRETGLMHRNSLAPDDGMLFVFPGEGRLGFWMKNTYVDLDMIFIGGDKRITVVHHDVPRSGPDTPEQNVARRSGLGRYVLELPAGAARKHGLKEGDALGFALP